MREFMWWVLIGTAGAFVTLVPFMVMAALLGVELAAGVVAIAVIAVVSLLLYGMFR